MIPVKQTKFGPDNGNCFTACIASIFELPIDETPQFCKSADDYDWFQRLENWSLYRGLLPLGLKYDSELKLNGVYAILSGKSPRGPWLHSVVWKDGEVIHDPHPDNRGIENMQDVIVFVVKNPALHIELT